MANSERNTLETIRNAGDAPSKMLTIQKAVSDDFERVFPLFEGFGDALIPKESWQKIFAPPWKSPEDFCGYLLLQNNDVKGYLGLIFSERLIDCKPEKFCNMTSWIVKQEFRSHSMLLLLESLKLKNYTLTNFTASPTVATILKRLGFTELPMHQQVVLPFPDLSLGAHSCTCVFDPARIRTRLAEVDCSIFDDHQQLNCKHLLLSSEKDDCYVVLKKTWRKHLPFAKIHYVSRPDVFVACIERLALKICLWFQVCGVMVDERYLRGHVLKRGVSYPHQRRAYIKAASNAIDVTLTDTLYSELVVLHN